MTEPLLDIGEVVELRWGDYLFISHDDLSLCIEDKTVPGILSDLISGRLYTQLQGLSEMVDIPILLLRGVYAPTHDGFIRTPSITMTWRYSSLENLLLDAYLKGILVVKVPSGKAAVQLIRSYYQYAQKPDHKFQIRRLKLMSYSAEVPAALYLVSALPGINTVLARALLERFENPLGVFTASEDDLVQVDGIGRKRAQAIRKALQSNI